MLAAYSVGDRLAPTVENKPFQGAMWALLLHYPTDFITIIKQKFPFVRQIVHKYNHIVP